MRFLDLMEGFGVARRALMTRPPHPSTTTTCEYDTAGNTTNLNGVALEWDERYRLKSVKSAQSVEVSYEYDVLNRRTSRTQKRKRGQKRGQSYKLMI